MRLHLILFLKCPEIDLIHFQLLSCFQSDNVPSFRNAPFFMFQNLEMLHFSQFQNQMEKWGISRFSNKKKGFTRRKNVIDLKSRTKPKINMTDSGAVQKQTNAITCKINPSHTFLGHFK